MASVSVRFLLAVAAAAPCAGQIDPQHSANLTVYHLNPKSAGAIPVNMDTGDTRGDLYFYLGEFLLPLECANVSKASRSKFDCDNPERVDPNLVVTKVDMEIDSRPTTYSACNLCNGTDPFTHKPCTVGTYVCDCFSMGRAAKCDAGKVGSESIKDHFLPHKTKPECAALLDKDCGSVKNSSSACGFCVLLRQKALKAANCTQYDFYDFCPSRHGGCSATSPAWSCWGENIPRKTGGNWYSTLAQGKCNKSSPVGTCGWNVLSTTTVTNKCLQNKLVTRVESVSPSCFSACGARNMTSSCWITCFFDAILGPEAAHNSSATLGGLSTDEIAKTWESAFLPEAQGGCEQIDMIDAVTPRSQMIVV